jgi:hypothetical protein
MIWALIAIAVNRDIQGDPAYIRCARCGTVATCRCGPCPRPPGSLAGCPSTPPPSRVDLPVLRT